MAVRHLKWYASWVQNVVRQFGPYDNPYAPIIPCHRIVSASGLGGYCGATEGALLDIKIKLLRFEAEQCR